MSLSVSLLRLDVHDVVAYLDEGVLGYVSREHVAHVLVCRDERNADGSVFDVFGEKEAWRTSSGV